MRAAALTAHDRWWAPFTTLAGYTEPVDHEFAEGGLIELVPAGRQDAGYAARVNSIDWASFYEDLGGGVVLELDLTTLTDAPQRYLER